MSFEILQQKLKHFFLSFKVFLTEFRAFLF